MAGSYDGSLNDTSLAIDELESLRIRVAETSELLPLPEKSTILEEDDPTLLCVLLNVELLSSLLFNGEFCGVSRNNNRKFIKTLT